MRNKNYDTGDYEKREEVAIKAGKSELARGRWFYERTYQPTKGFFVEIIENDRIHPNYLGTRCVDGVGTKLFLSAWSGNYTLAPLDALAMSANDKATLIHALIDTVDIYMAVQGDVAQYHMGNIMHGFANGFEMLRIPEGLGQDLNIGKIETASLDEMISLGVPGKGWDVSVSMTGFIPKNKVPHLNPQPGHVIVGVSSTGMHSNSFTDARHFLLTPDIEPREKWKNQYKGRFELTDKPEILDGKNLQQALEVPTAFYYIQAYLIGNRFNNRDIYGVNITGNGIKNFNRAGQDVSFEITDPFDPMPIHQLIVQESDWNPEKAYKKLNMGMGFAYIVPTHEIASQCIKQIHELEDGEIKLTAKIIGEVSQAKRSETSLRTTIHKPYEGTKLDFVGYNV